MAFQKIPKDDTQHQNHLDGTAKLLGQNLQQQVDGAGLDNHLQGWIEDLKHLNNPDLHEMVVDLQELKAHMHSGTLDNLVIAHLLRRLGNNTTRAANFAENPNTAERVLKLADALVAAADQLTS
ncbi:hypothetical protein [Hymenobacter sp. DG25A]|jgi:hypothetical protein|uniref:hypothetical protein n=1 Tax=Hymenobacter sp. DG25A TaxID=1385663 RepID=UPI0006BD2DB7|nr:hypothetical protein [Hymenobacter sp. DG25A]ALD20234.1 hypothetical protein AM218_02050 [Hymenobacter sp. DG25A]